MLEDGQAARVLLGGVFKFKGSARFAARTRASLVQARRVGSMLARATARCARALARSLVSSLVDDHCEGGDARDGGDEEGQQRDERERVGEVRVELVVDVQQCERREQVGHQERHVQHDHVVQVEGERRVVVGEQPHQRQRAGEAVHVARRACGGGARGELGEEAVDLHQVGRPALAHQVVFSEGDGAARVGRLEAGEDVLRQVDLLRRLGDAAARGEVKLVEQVGVAVVQTDVERLVEHALHQRAEVVLLRGRGEEWPHSAWCQGSRACDARFRLRG
eukprot:4901957-Pleurochrysis_carterae.AAC.5